MSANAAVLTTYLKDILFTESEVENKSESRDHIFEIKDNDGLSLGFILINDLKAYVYEHEEEAADYQVKNIDATEWSPVFKHPLFQRRKPQIIPNNSLKENNDQEFFILKHGQKTGPYNSADLTTMLDDKELLLTDMVSYNSGHTWMKLYQIDSFDRRVLKESDQLPGLPGKNILESSATITSINPTINETEAISSLAYLSNVKRGKSVEKEKIEVYQSDVVTKTSAPGAYKWLLVLSLIGIGYFLFHIKNQLGSPFENTETEIGEQQDSPMLTPVELNGTPMTPPKSVNQVNDQRRSQGKFETKSLRPIRANRRKSFMESPKYQETQKNNANSDEDPNYYYDNTSAMELDPVRTQVSKENYDNGGAQPEGPIPSSDNLFENEVTN